MHIAVHGCDCYKAVAVAIAYVRLALVPLEDVLHQADVLISNSCNHLFLELFSHRWVNHYLVPDRHRGSLALPLISVVKRRIGIFFGGPVSFIPAEYCIHSLNLKDWLFVISCLLINNVIQRLEPRPRAYYFIFLEKPIPQLFNLIELLGCLCVLFQIIIDDLGNVAFETNLLVLFYNPDHLWLFCFLPP